MDFPQATMSCSSTSHQTKSKAATLASHQIRDETKLCIIIDSSTPIILKVPIAPECLTLGQFKAFASLEQDCYKFYFKSLDSEFGIVKEEIVDDESLLPVDGDRIVAWVISNNTNNSTLFEPENPYERLNGTYLTETSSLVTGEAPRLPTDSRSKNSTNQAAETSRNTSLYAVNLLLDNYNFLGLTLVGPGDDISLADRGIYVGEISENSVVEQDGRIEVGDRIVEINGYNLTDMKSDDAVDTFRRCINRRGAINLVLERNLTNSPYNNKGRFTLPRDYANGINHHYTSPKPFEPQRSSHLNYLKNREKIPPIPMMDYSTSHPLKAEPTPESARIDLKNIRGTHSLPRSVTPRSFYAINNFDNFPSNDLRLRLDSRSVYGPSTPTSLRQCEVVLHCKKDNIHTIYAALRNDSKSLDIKDRDWLKVVIKNAFLGSNLVKWLSRNVYGFSHRREIKQYANQMLELGLIKNPMSSRSFSEKCYYNLS